jgi:hypothetical protein
LRVGDPRQLDDDPVVALALDRRFLDAGLVNAAADDLDRTADRTAVRAVRDAGLKANVTSSSWETVI